MQGNFDEIVRAAKAKLIPDAQTLAAVRILDDQFAERCRAIAIGPFPPDTRAALYDKAKQEYLEQIEGLADTEQDLDIAQ